MQMHFDELFQINPDDVATPKVHVRIGIKTLSPNKSTIHVSAKVVGDVPFSDFVGRVGSRCQERPPHREGHRTDALATQQSQQPRIVQLQNQPCRPGTRRYGLGPHDQELNG